MARARVLGPVIAYLALALMCSYGLALAGEPSSAWLWGLA